MKLIWSRCSPSEKMVLSVRNADLASMCRETNLGTNAEHFESCFYQMFETLDSWLQQKLTSTLQSFVWLPIMVCKAFFIQLTSLCKKCKRNVAGLFLALMSLWILLVWFSAFLDPAVQRYRICWLSKWQIWVWKLIFVLCASGWCTCKSAWTRVCRSSPAPFTSLQQSV